MPKVTYKDYPLPTPENDYYTRRGKAWRNPNLTSAKTKPVPSNQKKPFLTGHLGYKYAGPGNSIPLDDARQTYAKGKKKGASEKDKTESAAVSHDLRYKYLSEHNQNRS